jgi:predicted TIM-barrel fold metal-dependent hydrolase
VTLHDANAHLGHWPFRRLPFTGVEGLLARMDALGIQRAAVASNHAVLYRNVHEANRELAAWLEGHRDRLAPVATLDPNYPLAGDDLAWCAEHLAARALRLLPRWHGFDLCASEALELARLAAARGMTVVVPGRLEDSRQRHRMAPQTDVTLDEVLAFAAAVPDVRVLATELPVRHDDAVLSRVQAVPNLSFEISRMPGGAERTFARLVEALGADRFLFGTGMPFKVPEVALLKLETVSDASAAAAIARGNFERLFG